MTDPKTPAQIAQEKRREAHEATAYAAWTSDEEAAGAVRSAHAAIDSAIQAARVEVASEAHGIRCFCSPSGMLDTKFEPIAASDDPRCLAFRERIGRGNGE